ncbi:MAG: hypothetical protein KatS3mg063_0941 [Tepidiforma sp.]|uniref:urease accessory protein UreD n=1 Tax=Tepidiforma sp. TaxID=2682230 RepID=UPI0021DD38B2|nr:urease accessory protein UreD [Tepidiforma sp.]GIW15088.1 MAG: hypothetical protein KatS3mg063_0941 [Tepidiforma sp.]
MTSRARIAFSRAAGRTRVVTAFAQAPQRWTVGAAADGWLTVYHQFVGDGYFPGERSITRCEVGPGACARIEGPGATPLRPGTASLAATKLRVAAGGALVYRPGPLLPHAGSSHAALLDATVAAGGCLAVLQLWTPGRTAHEPGRFDRLVLRTRLAVEDAVILEEQLDIRPPDWPAGEAVVVMAVALGPWPPAETAWWDDILGLADGAASPLSGCGAIVRALFPSLGAAARCVDVAVGRIAAAPQMKICSSPRKALETESKAH